MISKDFLKGMTDFFKAARHLWGRCPSCGELFRLSDVAISSEAPPKPNFDSNKSDEFKYAWAYFAFHAKKRESMFNYSLVIAAALLTAFAWLAARVDTPLTEHALWVALVGVVIALFFFFLDKRNRDLVHRSERVLKRIEDRQFFLQERVDPTFDGIFLKDTGMEKKRWTESNKCLRWFVAHGFLLPAIEVLILILFLLLAYKIYSDPPQSPSHKATPELQTRLPSPLPSPSKQH
jgi:quinol-cytochrome oxidoreductase complex cytochrome b subunit